MGGAIPRVPRTPKSHAFPMCDIPLQAPMVSRRVGWVERSATHHTSAMGSGAHGRLHPSYAPT